MKFLGFMEKEEVTLTNNSNWCWSNKDSCQSREVKITKLPCQLTITSMSFEFLKIWHFAIPNLSVGDFPYKLDATASSGLPVSFYSSDPSLATIVGEYTYIRGAGDVTITAVQEGDNRYEPALSVEQSSRSIGATFSLILLQVSDYGLMLRM